MQYGAHTSEPTLVHHNSSSYLSRYLNSGPAGIAGYYIRSGLDDGGRRLAGWWGNDAATRFQMSPQFRPTPGAKGYQHSCTPVFSSIPLLATLELIDRATFPAMLEKQRLLTGAMESLLKASKFYRPDASTDASNSTEVGFTILTPEYPWRGTQLSLFVLPHREDDGAGKGSMPRVFERMLKKGLVGDEREPSVLRLSPVVLYNRFEEVGRAVKILEDALEAEVEYQQRPSGREESNASVDMLSKG